MMADTTDRKDQDDTTRIAPRSVDPEHRDKVGGDTDPSTSSARGRRREPEVVEADGGDIGGVAGGGIDSKVSGLGGDKNRR
jgi:hypothetical protein